MLPGRDPDGRAAHQQHACSQPWPPRSTLPSGAGQQAFHGGPVRRVEREVAFGQFLPRQFVESVLVFHRDTVFSVRAIASAAMALRNRVRACDTCHFVVPSLNPSIPAISAWLNPSMA